MDKLTVSIGADISDLQKGISQAEKEIQDLKKLKSDNIKIGADTSQINTAIDQAKAKLAGLQKSATGAGTAMQGFQKQTANGGVALTAFSRIAQDAPYGIIGIGNNITNTAEQFGYLTKQTGSAGGAVKAMLSSLAGIGGVILGVSLLVTGLTVMAQQGITVGDVIDKLTGKFDEFGNELKQASEKAVESVSSEIYSLKGLISVAQDETKSKRERLAAVNEIQNQYPGYFGNMSKEQIMTANLTSTVNELTQALINKEIAANLAKAAAPQLLALYKLNAVYKKQRKEYTDSQQALSRIGYEQGETSTTYKEAEATMWGYYDAMEKTRGEIYKSTQVNDRYNQSINAIIGSTSKLLIKAPPKGAKPKGAKPKGAKPKATRDQFATQDFGTTASGLFAGAQIKTPAIDDSLTIKSLQDFNLRAGTEYTKFQKQTDQFNETLSSIVTSGTIDALAGIGESVGTALATGGNVIEAVGKTILGSMGSMLKDLGKATIAYGVGLIAVKAAIKNPYTAIAAGVAMVAIGSAMSSAVSKSGKAVSGGGGSSSSSGGGSSSNYSASSGGFSQASSNGGTVVFEIAGQKLIGVLSNTLNANKRNGGATTLAL